MCNNFSQEYLQIEVISSNKGIFRDYSISMLKLNMTQSHETAQYLKNMSDHMQVRCCMAKEPEVIFIL